MQRKLWVGPVGRAAGTPFWIFIVAHVGIATLAVVEYLYLGLEPSASDIIPLKLLLLLALVLWIIIWTLVFNEKSNIWFPLLMAASTVAGLFIIHESAPTKVSSPFPADLYDRASCVFIESIDACPYDEFTNFYSSYEELLTGSSCTSDQETAFSYSHTDQELSVEYLSEMIDFLQAKLLVSIDRRCDCLSTTDGECVENLRRSMCSFMFPRCNATCAPVLPAVERCRAISSNCSQTILDAISLFGTGQRKAYYLANVLGQYEESYGLLVYNWYQTWLTAVPTTNEASVSGGAEAICTDFVVSDSDSQFTCRTPHNLTGHCMISDGSDYRGTVGKTIDGWWCQAWTEQSPNTHSRTSDNYPFYGIGDHTHCRNPDGEARPWCYVNVSAGPRWQECDISPCEEPWANRSANYPNVYQWTGHYLGYSQNNYDVANDDAYNDAQNLCTVANRDVEIAAFASYQTDNLDGSSTYDEDLKALEISESVFVAFMLACFLSWSVYYVVKVRHRNMSALEKVNSSRLEREQRHYLRIISMRQFILTVCAITMLVFSLIALSIARINMGSKSVDTFGVWMVAFVSLFCFWYSANAWLRPLSFSSYGSPLRAFARVRCLKSIMHFHQDIRFGGSKFLAFTILAMCVEVILQLLSFNSLARETNSEDMIPYALVITLNIAITPIIILWVQHRAVKTTIVKPTSRPGIAAISPDHYASTVHSSISPSPWSGSIEKGDEKQASTDLKKMETILPPATLVTMPAPAPALASATNPSVYCNAEPATEVELLHPPPPPPLPLSPLPPLSSSSSSASSSFPHPPPNRLPPVLISDAKVPIGTASVGFVDPKECSISGPNLSQEARRIRQAEEDFGDVPELPLFDKPRRQYPFASQMSTNGACVHAAQLSGSKCTSESNDNPIMYEEDLPSVQIPSARQSPIPTTPPKCQGQTTSPSSSMEAEDIHNSPSIEMAMSLSASSSASTAFSPKSVDSNCCSWFSNAPTIDRTLLLFVVDLIIDLFYFGFNYHGMLRFVENDEEISPFQIVASLLPLVFLTLRISSVLEFVLDGDLRKPIPNAGVRKSNRFSKATGSKDTRGAIAPTVAAVAGAGAGTGVGAGNTAAVKVGNAEHRKGSLVDQFEVSRIVTRQLTSNRSVHLRQIFFKIGGIIGAVVSITALVCFSLFVWDIYDTESRCRSLVGEQVWHAISDSEYIFYRNGFTQPSDCYLGDITSLDLSGLGLNSIPNGVNYFSGLQTLDLSNNQFVRFDSPTEQILLALPLSMKSIDLRNNQIDWVSLDVARHFNSDSIKIKWDGNPIISSLDWSGQGITSIEDDDVDANAIPSQFLLDFPSDVPLTLELRDNSITSLYVIATHLSGVNLEGLDLSHNNLDEFSGTDFLSLNQFDSLRYLNLSSCSLSSLSNQIDVSGFATIDWSHNSFSTIPEGCGVFLVDNVKLYGCNNVESIILDDLPITAFPPAIQHLNNLKSIDMTRVDVTTFPDWLTADNFPEFMDMYLDTAPVLETELVKLKDLFREQSVRHILELRDVGLTRFPSEVLDANRNYTKPFQIITSFNSITDFINDTMCHINFGGGIIVELQYNFLTNINGDCLATMTNTIDSDALLESYVVLTGNSLTYSQQLEMELFKVPQVHPIWYRGRLLSLFMAQQANNTWQLVDKAMEAGCNGKIYHLPANASQVLTLSFDIDTVQSECRQIFVAPIGYGLIVTFLTDLLPSLEDTNVADVTAEAFDIESAVAMYPFHSDLNTPAKANLTHINIDPHLSLHNLYNGNTSMAFPSGSSDLAFDRTYFPDWIMDNPVCRKLTPLDDINRVSLQDVCSTVNNTMLVHRLCPGRRKCDSAYSFKVGVFAI